LRRGGGDNEHGDDQDRADDFERGHGRDGHHHHQQVVHQRGGEPHRRCQLGIERADLQLFPKNQDDREVDDHDGCDRSQLSRQLEAGEFERVKAGLVEQAFEDAIDVEMNLADVGFQQHHAQCEQRREHDAHAGVGRHAAVLMKRLREERRQQADGGRADEQRHDVQAAGEDKCEHQAGQHGMGNGVTHQAHSPQHEIASDQRTSDVRHCADEDNSLRHGRGEYFQPIELCDDCGHS
jgi:hypothetical protein